MSIFSNSLSLEEGKLAKHRGLYIIKQSLQAQQPYQDKVSDSGYPHIE